MTTASEFAIDPSVAALIEDELRRPPDLNGPVHELITPDRLLVDLALLRDLRLGAALVAHYTPADPQRLVRAHAHIAERLAVYARRDFYDVAHAFPALGTSNAAIDARLADPGQHALIFALAPPTRFVRTLREQLAVNIDHSRVKGHRQALRITINTHPLRLSERLQGLVGRFVSETYGVEAAVTGFDPQTIDAERLLAHDEIYSAYPERLSANPDFSQRLSQLSLRAGKRLFFARFFGYAHNPKLDVNREAASVESTFGVLTDFFFVPSSVWTPLTASPQESRDGDTPAA